MLENVFFKAGVLCVSMLNLKGFSQIRVPPAPISMARWDSQLKKAGIGCTPGVRSKSQQNKASKIFKHNQHEIEMFWQSLRGTTWRRGVHPNRRPLRCITGWAQFHYLYFRTGKPEGAQPSNSICHLILTKYWSGCQPCFAKIPI